MGWYLPDFWLPDQKLWVEPKGQDPTDEEQRKCFFLADMSGAPVVCCFGPVGYGRVERYKGFPEEAATYQMKVYTGYYAPDQFATIREALFSDEFDPNNELNLRAFLCHHFPDDEVPTLDGRRQTIRKLIELDRRYFRNTYGKEHHKWQYGVCIRGSWEWHDGLCVGPDISRVTDDAAIVAALIAAQQARFEHGEHGAPQLVR